MSYLLFDVPAAFGLFVALSLYQLLVEKTLLKQEVSVIAPPKSLPQEFFDACVQAPLLEEAVCRLLPLALALHYFPDNIYALELTVFVSAVLFAFPHTDYSVGARALLPFVLGVVLGLVFLTSFLWHQSLLVAYIEVAIFHSLLNMRVFISWLVTWWRLMAVYD
jgi:hypothetical protein